MMLRGASWLAEFVDSVYNKNDELKKLPWILYLM